MGGRRAGHWDGKEEGRQVDGRKKLDIKKSSVNDEFKKLILYFENDDS